MKSWPVGLLLVILILPMSSPSIAATGPSFAGASAAVGQAFISVHAAGSDGGNVSSLVGQLNRALALIQKAEIENSTNPVQATADLGSALLIAQSVQAESPIVAQDGLASRQAQLEISVSAAVAIVAVAVALYIYGDRIYRRLWLRIYANHVVRKVG